MKKKLISALAVVENGVIHGCFKNESGQLRVIERGGCHSNESALDWNQTGPPGGLSGYQSARVECHRVAGDDDGMTKSTAVRPR